MLNKKQRQKNKSEIYKNYNIIVSENGEQNDYWFSAQNEDDALDMFVSFAEAKNLIAEIIRIDQIN